MRTGEAVAKRILELCAERGITVNRLCTISGVTQSTVNNIISGRNQTVTLSTVKKLCDGLEITIQEGDKILYRGTAASLNRANVAAADDVLGSTGASARRELTILFHYPEAGDNSGQNQTLSFKLCADAVQTKNNNNKEFE